MSLYILFPEIGKYRNIITISGGTTIAAALLYFISHIGRELPLKTIFFWAGAIYAIAVSLRLYVSVMRKMSAEKQALETEIELARNIQKKLVPAVELNDERCRIFGRTLSANQIGGDFFDIIHLSENGKGSSELGIAMGDVSGHNMAAGLLMAIVKGALRAAISAGSTAEELPLLLNRIIRENAEKNMFVSFIYGMINFRKRELTLLNAGHLPVFHLNASGTIVRQWNPRGIALGLAARLSFDTQTISLDKNDMLLFFTDGLIEAGSSEKNEYGINNLQKVLQAAVDHAEPKAVYESVMADLKKHMGSLPVEDDLTMVIVRIP
ncbi:MAG: PP2C family protein-serine/threonine phosphatase [Calditrichia bacterium]